MQLKGASESNAQTLLCSESSAVLEPNSLVAKITYCLYQRLQNAVVTLSNMRLVKLLKAGKLKQAAYLLFGFLLFGVHC